MPTGKDRAVLPGTQEKTPYTVSWVKSQRFHVAGREVRKQPLWTEIFPYPSLNPPGFLPR